MDHDKLLPGLTEIEGKCQIEVFTKNPMRVDMHFSLSLPITAWLTRGVGVPDAKRNYSSFGKALIDTKTNRTRLQEKQISALPRQRSSAKAAVELLASSFGTAPSPSVKLVMSAKSSAIREQNERNQSESKSAS